ncbi:hypothetical protein D3C76_682510 [compost metagenome]
MIFGWRANRSDVGRNQPTLRGNSNGQAVQAESDATVSLAVFQFRDSRAFDNFDQALDKLYVHIFSRFDDTVSHSLNAQTKLAMTMFWVSRVLRTWAAIATAVGVSLCTQIESMGHGMILPEMVSIP